MMNEDNELTSVSGDVLSRDFLCNLGGNVDLNGVPIRVGPFIGVENKVVVGRGLTPYDNKVKMSSTNVDAAWINSDIDIDLRYGKKTAGEYALHRYTDPLGNNNLYLKCDQSTFTGEFLKYSNYDINNVCGRICDTRRYAAEDACFASVVKPSVNDITNVNVNAFDSIAGLAVRVGGSDLGTGGSDFNGEQCLPSETGGNCAHVAEHNNPLFLGKKYMIGDHVSYDANLMLGITGKNYGGGSRGEGGYHVTIRKDCWKSQGEGLYIYVSPDGQAPDFAPGEVGTGGEEAFAYKAPKEGARFTINRDTPSREGRIFFGVRGAQTSVADASRPPESKTNKYEVHIRKKLHPAHVTAIVTWLRDWILDALYGGVLPKIDRETYYRINNLIQINKPNAHIHRILEVWKEMDPYELKDQLDGLVVGANRNVTISLFNATGKDLVIRSINRDVGDDIIKKIKKFSPTKTTPQQITSLPPSIVNNFSDVPLANSTMVPLNPYNVYHILEGGIYQDFYVHGVARTLLCDIDTVSFTRVPGRIIVYPDGTCYNDYSVKSINNNDVNFSTYDTAQLADNLHRGLHHPDNSNGSSLLDKRDGGIVQKMFHNLLRGDSIKAIRAMMVLYVAVSSILFITGMVKTPKFDFLVRILKITFVLQLTSVGAWDFFNKYIFAGIYQGMQELIGIIGATETGNVDFKFLDKILGFLLAEETWIRIVAISFVGPMGVLILCIVGKCFWELFCAVVLQGLTMYFLSMVAVSFLIAVSPIFLASIMFQRTKGLFDGWMKALINYGLQPVFLFGFLSLLCEIALTFMHQVVDYSVCYRCMWEITLAFLKICLFGSIMPFGATRGYDLSSVAGSPDVGFMGIPFSIFSLLMLWLISHSIETFVHMAQLMTQALTNSMGGVEGSTPSEGNQGAGAKKMADSMKEPFGRDARTMAAKEKARSSHKNRSNKSILEFVPKFGKGGGSNAPEASKDGGDKSLKDDKMDKSLHARGDGLKDIDDPDKAREGLKDHLKEAKDYDGGLKDEVDKMTDKIQGKIDDLEGKDAKSSKDDFDKDQKDIDNKYETANLKDYKADPYETGSPDNPYEGKDIHAHDSHLSVDQSDSRPGGDFDDNKDDKGDLDTDATVDEELEAERLKQYLNSSYIDYGEDGMPEEDRHAPNVPYSHADVGPPKDDNGEKYPLADVDPPKKDDDK